MAGRPWSTYSLESVGQYKSAHTVTSQCKLEERESQRPEGEVRTDLNHFLQHCMLRQTRCHNEALLGRQYTWLGGFLEPIVYGTKLNNQLGVERAEPCSYKITTLYCE